MPSRSTRALPARFTVVWWALVSVLVVLSVLAVVVEPDPSELPAALTAALVAVTGVAAIAVMIGVQRGAYLDTPEDDDAALAAFRARQAMLVAIAIGPVLLGAALAVVFGHRTPAVAAVAVGAAAVGVGFPRSARIERVEETWRHAGRDVSIRRALGHQ